jgi:hypothetical protein
VIFFEFLRTLEVDFADVSKSGVTLENLLGGKLSGSLVLFGMQRTSRSQAAESRSVGYHHVWGLVVSSMFKVF